MDEDLLSNPFRPLPIRAMNALGRGLSRVGLKPISLAEDSLLSAARRASGLDDFGPETFRPGLQKLLESVGSHSWRGRIARRRARSMILGGFRPTRTGLEFDEGGRRKVFMRFSGRGDPTCNLVRGCPS